MARVVKLSTQIKNIMTTFVAENGLKNIDITTNNIRFYVLEATRFHHGQINIWHPEHGAWIADYTKSGNLGTPKHIKQLKTGGWVLA